MKNSILTILLVTFSITGILLMFFGILGLSFAYVYTYNYKMGGSYALLGIGLGAFLLGFIPLIKINKKAHSTSKCNSIKSSHHLFRCKPS